MTLLICVVCVVAFAPVLVLLFAFISNFMADHKPRTRLQRLEQDAYRFYDEPKERRKEQALIRKLVQNTKKEPFR